ncbi:DNA-processing protein DprA [Oxalobacter vibrioformis]|uniref:DNA-processing protein DprA n=1 Tax=Oxalobacter vibrioformis TaxID=933080 RepID=A0A9E9LWJ8_9BURK|nr:DNA-processing protein DprA [Oxalobacter vibrioformis]WAW11075.1 DNA-processing protein DprA [Oxalobacter vibrioformis]
MQKTKLSREELASWIRLLGTEGIGSGTARNLLSVFGMPQDVFSASLKHLESVVPGKTAHLLLLPPTDDMQAQIEKTVRWMGEPGNRILTLADPDYPPALLEIPDPPVMLYVKGRIELLFKPAIAIVGSRNASRQGCRDAEKFAETLGHAGWTIISGMALGIDAAAHAGGLASPASTIAVIGTGADIIYPSRNQVLARRIAQEGCMISEYPLGMAALASNFPRRNRIISGLSRGVLVVEAAARSGSLITAHVAAEQGRDVFAIPGSIHSPLSRGCHQLIRQGAKLVETAQDIMEELPPLDALVADLVEKADRMDEAEMDEDAERILSALGFDPVDPDRLCERLEMDIAVLNAILLEMEMDGLVELLPGGRYRRLAN